MRRLVTLVLAFTVGLSTAGCLGTHVLGESPTAPSAGDQREMMDRWNRTVDNTPSDFTQTTGFDFHWTGFYQFPHPTFKGGDEAAYSTFAALLLAYLQDEGNFAYLAQRRLFDAELSYELPSGQRDDFGDFRALVDAFSSTSSFGNIPEATRQGLAAIRTRIAEAG